ncbi:hypothetical protein DZC31_07855 [Stenotrophomonas rhizophila]|nr:hypothetical protein DZC31_07855 [Stenotrophomonas rhizophila]
MFKISSTPCVACSGLFAGLPAPTGIRQRLRLVLSCGSGRAREEASKGENYSRKVMPLEGNGNAVLYRTCLRAKLERILATPGNRVR